MSRSRLLTPLLLALAAVAHAQQSPKELFLAGTASYTQGDYAGAERQFLACRQALGDNAAVDFNLAVTYLRLEELGRARVYLERATRLAPRDRETRDQLRGLYSRLDQAMPPSPSWLHGLWDAARSNLTCSEALTLATVVELLAALLLGLWVLTRRRTWGWSGLAVGLVAVFLWSVALAALGQEVGPRRAVVVAESASLRGGPGEEFGEIARLTEGEDVRLLEHARLRFGSGLALRAVRGDQGLWREVRTPSGVRGYIRRSLIEPI